MTPPGIPKGTPEELRSAEGGPRRAPRPSQNHAQSALGEPWRVRKLSWGGFLRLGASFWSPQGQFYLLFLTFPNVLFSLLSLFSRICLYFHPLVSLLSALVSLLFSLFSSVFPAARRLSRSELGSAAPLSRTCSATTAYQTKACAA